MQRSTTTKEALRSLLHARPGLTPAEAARTLDVDPTTALYHLRRLASEGRIAVSGGPRTRRYWPPGPRSARTPPPPRSAREVAPLLDALRQTPGATQSELSRRLGVPRATVAGRLVRLRREGVVTATRQGREVRLHLASGA